MAIMLVTMMANSMVITMVGKWLAVIMMVDPDGHHDHCSVS